MLVIIIGVIICFVLYKIMTKDMKDEKITTYEVVRFYCQIVVISIVVVFIFMGLFFPTKFGKWEKVSETQLVTLSNSTVANDESEIYLIVTEGNNYTYRCEIASEFETGSSKEYVVRTISGDIIESELENYKDPVLMEYKRKSKMTIWTFGLGYAETKYVFYVPKGSIQRE